MYSHIDINAYGHLQRTGSWAPARILVVDDDPQTLRCVRNAPARAGCTATATRNPDGCSV